MSDSSNTRLDAVDAIAEMDKAMGALRYELPEDVWNDVDARYRRVRSLAVADDCGISIRTWSRWLRALAVCREPVTSPSPQRKNWKMTLPTLTIDEVIEHAVLADLAESHTKASKATARRTLEEIGSRLRVLLDGVAQRERTVSPGAGK